MTRTISTESEVASGEALLDYLREKGHAVHTISREINDRPDLFFRFDSDRIGCECVQIPPARIFKYLHAKFKQLEKADCAAVRVIWPQEQHFWVKEAIESKKKKISAYKRNCGTNRIWLLIHAPTSAIDNTIHYEKNEIMGLMKYAAKKTNHNFEEVYFWGPKTGITKLYPVSPVWTEVKFDFERGYPTNGFVMAKAKFFTTEEGAQPVEYDYGVVTPDIIVVPPLDPEFRNHQPRYTIRKYRLRVIAGATDGQVTFDPIDE